MLIDLGRGLDPSPAVDPATTDALFTEDGRVLVTEDGLILLLEG